MEGYGPIYANACFDLRPVEDGWCTPDMDVEAYLRERLGEDARLPGMGEGDLPYLHIPEALKGYSGREPFYGGFTEMGMETTPATADLDQPPWEGGFLNLYASVDGADMGIVWDTDTYESVECDTRNEYPKGFMPPVIPMADFMVDTSVAMPDVSINIPSIDLGSIEIPSPVVSVQIDMAPIVTNVISIIRPILAEDQHSYFFAAGGCLTVVTNADGLVAYDLPTDCLVQWLAGLGNLTGTHALVKNGNSIGWMPISDCEEA